jgi:hypothetical protein
MDASASLTEPIPATELAGQGYQSGVNGPLSERLMS